MNYWYFLFEGVFKSGSPKYGMKGVCSSALVPAETEEIAKKILLEALCVESIDLVNIDDSFQFVIEDIDVKDKDNEGWLSLYEEVLKANQLIFTPWQVFENE